MIYCERVYTLWLRFSRGLADHKLFCLPFTWYPVVNNLSEAVLCLRT